MSIDLEPFLQRIRAYPDDDAPRLILADWLEEQGGESAARAQFIRVQIALAGLKSSDPRRDGLIAAERALLEQHHQQWEAPFRRLATGLIFRRGFVEELNVDARDFVRHAHDLFAAGPIRHLHLLNLGGHLPEVLASPYIGRLRALTILASRIGPSLGQALGEAANLGGLRALFLQINQLGDTGISHLARSMALANLEELNLAENEFTDGAAMALAASPHFGKLRRLDLRSNAIGPAGAAALARSESLAALTHVNLAFNKIGSARSQAHRWDGNLLRFQSLDLTKNDLTPESLKSLLGVHPASRQGDMKPERARGGLRIQELDLSQNDIGELGARVLAESESLRGLVVLRLAQCNITDTAARILASSPLLRNLETLEIGNNPVGDLGLQAFLHTSLRRLRRLMIPSFGVSHEMQNAIEDRFPGGVIRH
jgi:uncharacterized protein (TIGR02996 family)